MSGWINDLAILFWLWLRHPTAEMRTLAGATIQERVNKANPLFSRHTVNDLVRGVEGTLLDPFILDDDELEAAGAFIRLALSEESEQGAVRIVPSSTIGRAGGLVIGPGPTTQYFSRSILEGKTTVPQDIWSFIPGEMPTPRSGLGARIGWGRSGPTQSGYVLLELPGSEPALASLTAEYWTILDNSHLSSHPLPSLGVAIEFGDEGGLGLRATTPEAMIRVASAMSQGSALTIDAGDVGETPRILAQLPYPPPETVTEIPIIVLPRSPSQEPDHTWLFCDLECPVPQDLVLAALPHLPLPMHWPIPSEPEVLIEAIQSS